MLTRKNKCKWDDFSWKISCNRFLRLKPTDERKEIDKILILNRVTPKTFCRTASSSNDPLTAEKKQYSKSLSDLSDSQQQHRKESRKRTKSLTCEPNDISSPILFRQIPYWSEKHIVSDAGRRILIFLMLQAWRRRREDHSEARAVVSTLTNQVGNLNMQIYALRQLLDNEKNRTEIAAKTIQKNLSKIEEFEQERKVILKENERLEADIKEFQSVINDLKNKCKNQKNDLATARQEVENWENRLKKERKKLKALRDEKIILQKEAESREDLLAFQSQGLEQLNQTNKELQEKLDAHIPLLNEAVSQIQTLMQEKAALVQEYEQKHEKALSDKDEQIRLLLVKIGELNEEIVEQQQHNAEIAKLLKEKIKDLIVIKEEVAEMSELVTKINTKNEKSWGTEMIKLASFCTRIPIVVIYTLATLLLPQPSHRNF